MLCLNTLLWQNGSGRAGGGCEKMYQESLAAGM
jgi:hypothetical protein